MRLHIEKRIVNLYNNMEKSKVPSMFWEQNYLLPLVDNFILWFLSLTFSYNTIWQIYLCKLKYPAEMDRTFFISLIRPDILTWIPCNDSRKGTGILEFSKNYLGILHEGIFIGNPFKPYRYHKNGFILFCCLDPLLYLESAL